MATIGIKGIRIDKIDIKPTEDGELIEAEYSLISTVDRVLAKQSVGGYNGMKVQPSAATLQALRSFVAAYKSDVNVVLGLDAS